MGFLEEAKKKLEAEAKAGKFDKYGNAMKGAVLKALKEFCAQSEIFAEAVVKGRSFEECMKAVGKGVTNGSISDLKAYQLAVKYYLPDADVRFCMEIQIGNDRKTIAPEQPAQTKPSESVMIDLTKFF